MTTPYHIPALLEQTIDGLAIERCRDGVFVDVTFGGGGHSREILRRLGVGGKLYSFDQDIEAYQNRIEDSRWQFVHGNFRYIKNFLRYYGEDKVDGIVADLGVSFHHFDESDRGFSFRFSGPLDMRMNTSARTSAADIVNQYDEENLSRIFYLYGELKQARQIARTIIRERSKQSITTTEQLTSLLTPVCGRDKEKKDLARVFQALRIEVNDEMGALEDLLLSALQVVRKGGRISILTYHSLEDRMVKNFFRSGRIDGQIDKDFYGNVLTPFELVNKKVITASQEEVEQNPRSRSAKLRIAEVKENL